MTQEGEKRLLELGVRGPGVAETGYQTRRLEWSVRFCVPGMPHQIHLRNYVVTLKKIIIEIA